MAAAFLRRFDITAYRNRSISDDAQVPLAQARVDFYRQGATVSAGPITINHGASQTIQVYDIGRLEISDTVLAGVGGPTLTVTEVIGPHQIALSNNLGYPVTLTSGTRLVPTSDRPTVYQDPYGTVALGCAITADSGGRATCYVDEKRFDYIVAGPPVTFGSASSQTLTGTGPTMEWGHTATGSDRLVLVGISWQDTLGEESIASVTYGGVAMTRLATNLIVDVWFLVNPPTGPQNIIVTWSGTLQKGAIGGAVSFAGVDPVIPLGTFRAAEGSNSPVQVRVAGTHPHGFVMDTVGVQSPTGLTSLTAASDQMQRWNANAGTTSTTRTQGAGSTEPGKADSGPVEMTWTLGESRHWLAVAVEARPVAIRLVIDAEGSALLRSHMGLNAADFPTIQDAIDACPDGGAVYIPAGEWDLSLHGCDGTLVVRQEQHTSGLTIFGDGWATKLKARDADSDCIKIERTDANRAMGNFVIRDLRIEGQSQPGSGRSIYLKDIHSITLRNVMSWGSAAYALDAYEVQYLSCIDCHLAQGKGTGIRIYWSNQAYFLGCTVMGFDDWLFKGEGGGGYVIIGGEYSTGHLDPAGKSATDAWVDFDQCGGIMFIRPAMEGYANDEYPTRTAIKFTECDDGVVIGGGMTGHGHEVSDGVGISLIDSHGFEIGTNGWVNTKTAITVDGDCSHIFIAPQYPESGTAAIEIPSAEDRADKHITVIDRQGIVPPVFTPGGEPSPPPEGAFWYRGTGDAKGWYGWDGAKKLFVVE